MMHGGLLRLRQLQCRSLESRSFCPVFRPMTHLAMGFQPLANGTAQQGVGPLQGHLAESGKQQGCGGSKAAVVGCRSRAVPVIDPTFSMRPGSLLWRAAAPKGRETG